LDDVRADDVLHWYAEISDAIVGVASSVDVPGSCRAVVAEIATRVEETISNGADHLLARLIADGRLSADELVTETVVERDLVEISLLGANLYPTVFEYPDDFIIDRHNVRQHVTFVQGPHGCLGLHLARLETVAAINAVLDAGLALDATATTPPSGLIFRKPELVAVTTA
jgi:hypothetical protein